MVANKLKSVKGNEIAAVAGSLADVEVKCFDLFPLSLLLHYCLCVCVCVCVCVCACVCVSVL